MKRKILLRILSPAILLALIVLSISCSTQRPTGYDLQAQIWDKDEDDSVTKIYLTGTKRIDSVDVDKLIYDIWRIEIDEYPELLKVYGRVYDSLGNFVTNMAYPYKLEKDSNTTYFTSVREQLGKVYNVRDSVIDPFHVREYGANDSIPYNIVLSVDYSGSMNGVMDAIYDGTEIFVDMKMKYDNIALTTFNKDFDIKVPLENDKKKILNMYRVKKKEGFGLFTAIYDALWKGTDLFLETPKDVPRVFVIFSDGDDNYSKLKIPEIYKKCKENKINVFAVAFGYSKDDNLRDLAKYTGGKFYKAYTKKELIAIFRDIYMSLRYYYYITYRPPKYWGYHHVYAGLNVPGMADSLLAEGEYDTSDMFPWDSINKAFKRPILFDFDSAIVKPNSYYILDEITDAMMSKPTIRIEIQGHTDNIGGWEYNMDLSNQRAQAVKDGLVSRGIEAGRLRSRGFGFSEPLMSNDTEEGRVQNRRTVFKILAK